MILRAKTKMLFDQFSLTERQQNNTDLNLAEIEDGKTFLQSFPRRLVLELTNACNLHCMMCGRSTVKFEPTFFQLNWLKKFESILNDVEEVAMFGWGEPTVHPKFIDLLAYLDQYPVRKYFCTNGMRLDTLRDAIFTYHVDIIAVSLDGASAETNDRIRCGGSLQSIVSSLRDIVNEKKARKLKRPYMNFVFCAMKSNIDELPDLVRLAADIGLEEVKVVYFTAFEEELLKESLWNCSDKVSAIFQEALALGDKLNVRLKLPHLQGEDVAQNKMHKDCFVGWRDLFLGSDGYVRPCMSTPDKFFKFTDELSFAEIWNHPKYQDFRGSVNQVEKMNEHCQNCYQSSHCNWNKKESFVQVGHDFAPKWEK